MDSQWRRAVRRHNGKEGGSTIELSAEEKDLTKIANAHPLVAASKSELQRSTF